MSAQKVNGIEEKNALDRVYEIPFVNESVKRILSTIQANSYAAALYARSEELLRSVYKFTQPVLEKLPLAMCNNYANKSLDFVQQRYPTVFEIHTDEIVQNARKPADAAVDIFQTRLNAAQQSLAGAQDRLAGVVSRVPKTQEEASKAMSDLLNELNKMKDSASSNVRELPSNVQQIVNPLIEHLNTGIHDISNELARRDIPMTHRANNALQYSRDNAVPVIQETLENLKKSIIKKKEETEQKVDEQKGEVGSYAEAAKKDAIGPH